MPVSKTYSLRLRRDIYDQLCAARSISKRADQAAALGLNRRTIARLRAGQQPSFATAVHIADTLGVSVDLLFERVDAVA